MSRASSTAKAPEPRRELHPVTPTGGLSLAAQARSARLQRSSAALQSAMGNQAVLRMMSGRRPVLQTKLAVNEPGDRYEQEADRVAEQVMRMPESAIAPQRISPSNEETSLQRKSQGSPGEATAPPIVHEVLRSPGQALDTCTRAFFEPRFGADFSSVRVHTDGQAAESTSAVKTVAYTVGNNIAFATGRYSPRTTEGCRLLAHELAHVVQQGSASPAASGKPPVGSLPVYASDPVTRSGLRASAAASSLDGLVQRSPLHPPKIRTQDEIDRGAATLAKDMARELDHWKNQADWGIQDFVNEELERRIDSLRKAGLTKEAFLQSLLGNVIWAVACFLGEAPELAFVVSMVGIGVAASAVPPTASKPADVGAVSGLAEQVQRLLDRIEDEMRGTNDTHLLDQARNLILFNPDLSEPELLELFMTQNFDRSLLRAEVGGKLTGFNDEQVKRTQKQAIEVRFQHFMDVIPLVGSKTEPETVVGRTVGGEYTLSLVHVSGVGGDKPEDEKWGIGYEIVHRETDLQGNITKLGNVVVAQWVEEDTVNAVLNREADLKIYPLIINAFATEVSMGPESFKLEQEKLREDERLGGLRPG